MKSKARRGSRGSASARNAEDIDGEARILGDEAEARERTLGQQRLAAAQRRGADSNPEGEEMRSRVNPRLHAAAGAGKLRRPPRS